jgi:hypothetical protein
MPGHDKDYVCCAFWKTRTTKFLLAVCLKRRTAKTPPTNGYDGSITDSEKNSLTCVKRKTHDKLMCLSCITKMYGKQLICCVFLLCAL